VRYRQIKFAKGGYVPKIRGYARVSHKSQFDKGRSIADQEARIQAYIQLRQVDGVFNNAIWDKMYIEPRAQSAYSKPFMSRVAGSQLWEALQPGDHVVVDKLDRMFRNMHDFCTCEKFFGERGIRIHFVNFKGMAFDTGTTGGDFMIKIFALMSEAESDRIGERTALARKMLRAQSKHMGVMIPFFCTLRGAREGAKRGGGGVLVFKDWTLPLMKEIKQRYEAGEGFHKMGKAGMYNKMASLGIHMGADFRENVRKLRKMYTFYCAWMDCGMPNINTIQIMHMIRDYQSKKRGRETDGPTDVQ